MIDRPAPRNLRTRTSLVTIGSLTVAVGLTASLGLARTVWGGPPAADVTEQPAEPAPQDDGAASEEASASDDFLDADPTTVAAEPVAPVEDSPRTIPLASELPSSGVSAPGASTLRSKMEASMSELGEMAVEARSDEDLVRATCVLDKQDRANDVMELGTSELLIIRDPGTSEQARSFALEKLDAASLRMDKLVDEAKACSGRQGPEEEVEITRNTSDEPRTIPLWDPTAGLGHPPEPPPLDGAWPPAASPTE